MKYEDSHGYGNSSEILDGISAVGLWSAIGKLWFNWISTPSVAQWIATCNNYDISQINSGTFEHQTLIELRITQPSTIDNPLQKPIKTLTICQPNH